MQRTQIYCRHCGAIPGVATTCTGKFGIQHSWEHLKTERRVYCDHCGVTPGSPSKCPGKYGDHSWVVLKG